MDYIFITIILICGFLDFKTRTIPNKITIPLTFICLIYQVFQGHELASVMGLAISFGIGLFSFALNGMGGGDVKLMAAMGAWLGPFPFLYVLFIGSIVGVIWGIFLFIRHKILARKIKEIASKVALVYYNALKITEFVKNNEGENRCKQHLTIPFGACLSIALLYINIYPIQF